MQDFEAQAAVTDEAVRLVDEARAGLDAFAGGRLKGFDLFADPSMQRMHLVAAGRAVTAALAAMDGTRWPSAAEMASAEGEA